MSAIDALFAGLRRPALMPYLCAGFPDSATFRALLRAAADGGADLVEIGIPFSDPIADGPAIQHAAHEALLAGTTPAKALEWSTAFEGAVKVVMTYVNPVLSAGPARFFRAAAAAGFSGAIVPDLTPEGASRHLSRAGQVLAECWRPSSARLTLSEPGGRVEGCMSRVTAGREEHTQFRLDGLSGLDLIPMVAPTTPADRLGRLVKGRGGFVYLVSVAGVTGARRDLPSGLEAFVKRVKRATPRPVCVGFGIATPAHAAAVGRFADGVIVGSALVNLIRASGKRRAPGGVRRFLEKMRRGLDAARD